ncbi:hypothetical protein ACFSTC_33300 [Nonomuraea ferruginea]
MDEVVVSTDHPGIAEAAERAGARVVERPSRAERRHGLQRVGRAARPRRPGRGPRGRRARAVHERVHRSRRPVGGRAPGARRRGRRGLLRYADARVPVDPGRRGRQPRPGVPAAQAGHGAAVPRNRRLLRDARGGVPRARPPLLR